MNRRLRLLELYCGAGGSAEGYARAGFEVVGVDISKQPRFPYRFVQMDVFEFLRRVDVRRYFDVIHAGPPCQGYSPTRRLHTVVYPKLIKRTRRHLDAIGLPYVIENVEGARPAMHEPIRLCGSSFGLRVRRHRLFECSFPLTGPPPCMHAWQDADKRFHTFTSKTRASQGRPAYKSGIVPVYGGGQGLGAGESLVWRAAMGISWMTKAELAEAIPPAFTQFIGGHMLFHLLGHEAEDV